MEKHFGGFLIIYDFFEGVYFPENSRRGRIRQVEKHFGTFLKIVVSFEDVYFPENAQEGPARGGKFPEGKESGRWKNILGNF